MSCLFGEWVRRGTSSNEREDIYLKGKYANKITDSNDIMTSTKTIDYTNT